MNINDQARRIGEQEGTVLGKTVYFEHDPRAVCLELAYADLFQEPIVYIETLANQG